MSLPQATKNGFNLWLCSLWFSKRNARPLLRNLNQFQLLVFILNTDIMLAQMQEMRREEPDFSEQTGELHIWQMFRVWKDMQFGTAHPRSVELWQERISEHDDELFEEMWRWWMFDNVFVHAEVYIYHQLATAKELLIELQLKSIEDKMVVIDDHS